MMFTGNALAHDVRVTRLDAEFYNPLHVENARMVEALNGTTLANLCSRLIDHSFLSVRADDYQDSGVPFVRVKNLKGISLDENFVFISEEANQREAQTICGPGDLLFAKTGKIAACPVPAHIPRVNTSQDVMVATVKQGTDSHYVAAYLNCHHGALYQDRYIQGPVQPHLSLGSLRQIYVPVFHCDAQKYIGDKVRLAERLRNQSAVLMKTSLALLDALVEQRLSESEVPEMFSTPNMRVEDIAKILDSTVLASRPVHAATMLRRSSRVASGTLSNRLDASYYTDEVLNNARMLTALGAKELRDMVCPTMSGYGVLPDSNDYVSVGVGGVPLIRGGDLMHGGINPPAVFVPARYSTERDLTSEDDILMLIKGACIDGPAGVGLVLAKEVKRLFNGSCYRLRTTDVDPGYLVAYFQTSSFLIQKRREIANTGISYNSEDSIRRFLIPRFGDAVESVIARLVRRSLVAKYLAASLIEAATHLLEALIEGNIAEKDLRNARLALVQGDSSHDRTILSRLTDGGFEAQNNSALFVDLDSLYRAIAEMESREASNGDAA